MRNNKKLGTRFKINFRFRQTMNREKYTHDDAVSLTMRSPPPTAKGECLPSSHSLMVKKLLLL